MSQGIFITTTTSGTGKSLVALGLADSLYRRTGSIGYFRPIIPGDDVAADPMVQLVRGQYQLDETTAISAMTASEARRLQASGRAEEIYTRCVELYEQLAARTEVVIIEGTDLGGEDSAIELELNAQLARNFNVPVIAVVSGRGLDAAGTADAVDLTRATLDEAGQALMAVIVNRAEPSLVDEIYSAIRPGKSARPVYVIPELTELSFPSVAEVVRELHLVQTAGSEHLDRDVSEIKAVSMEGGNFLENLHDASLVIVSGDRSDAVLATLASAMAENSPVAAGMILTNGIEPNGHIQRLYAEAAFPVFTTFSDTFTTAAQVARIRPELSSALPRKTSAALGAWHARVDADELLGRLEFATPTTMTPIRFLHEIISRASAQRQRIVLPEGTDPRILRAAEILRRRDVCDITLLGNVSEIEDVAAAKGVDLTGLQLIDPIRSPERQRYADAYTEARAHKGIEYEQAHEVMADGAYFGTMMVQLGDVDGMVSGAIGTTAHTIRPALEFVKTKPGVSIVSSAFLMLLPDKVLVYGDCAVNPNPDAHQLADIAIASADTATQFNVEPRVAMLSYSTGASGAGADVEKVREATELIRTARPELKVDGPLQYDAAVSTSVAASKMPGSEVAGQATVFIFPDLNTGNNTYKAVQQSAGAVAVGPILQGLNKPVNDLSRGTTVEDIVNTVAITAIQAQAE